jgi:L-ribulokinase
MFAATVAGIYPNVEAAMASMGSGFEKTYQPRKELSPVYEEKYKRYQAFGKLIQNDHIL